MMGRPQGADRARQIWIGEPAGLREWLRGNVAQANRERGERQRYRALATAYQNFAAIVTAAGYRLHGGLRATRV